MRFWNKRLLLPWDCSMIFWICMMNLMMKTGWRNSKIAWLTPFQEKICLAFLFQQEMKLTRYASNAHFICPMALVELHDSHNYHVSCRTQGSFVTNPPPPFFLNIWILGFSPNSIIFGFSVNSMVPFLLVSDIFSKSSSSD